MNGETDYLKFWGKAGSALEGEPASHPAAYHCLDVAAAAEALLDANPRRLARLAALLETTPDNARRCLVALIALHDIGKFSDTFQQMVPSEWPTNFLGPIKPTAMRHHTVVAVDAFWRLCLDQLMAPAFDTGWETPLLDLWSAVAFHHGMPTHYRDEPTSDMDEQRSVPGMRSASLRSAMAFARDAVALFEPFDPLAPPTQEKLASLTWIVAGLVNLADWIGSNRESFPFHEPGLSLKDYLGIARKRAALAVSRSGLTNAVPQRAPNFAGLFDIAGDPSPLQQWAGSAQIPKGPALALVEDVTGSGKTEAALLLAARMMADDRAGGIFFALPTMATANAMFDRLGHSYRRMFAREHDPSLVLAHGRRALHENFTKMILPRNRPAGDGASSVARGDESSAACAAWIADDRRKAFFAEVGVGTIDQAFLSVLPAKFQALRLWGLADRVLIVDEAHAYDAYMGQELERLLEFHAALGGPAIVLSATLPTNQRTALANAFSRGLGATNPVIESSAYPLTTLTSASGAAETALETRVDRTRRLAVRMAPPGHFALDYVSKMAAQGAAVAWIRNSVDDAIEAANELRSAGFQPVLLHARFAMGDRLAIEERVRSALGKSAASEARRGFVLVGTQILEQSLDYDVDAMVTDLAPIDSIIQRAGRLWRHETRTREGRPVSVAELVVVSPDWNGVADSSWYAQVSPRAAAVYKHHGVIWRTARALAKSGAIVTPGGVRSLIEAVYAAGEQDNDDVPKPLWRASNEAIGAYRAQAAIAHGNLLEVSSGYSGNNALWTDDGVTPTRLGDPVTVFRLGRVEGGRLVPWCIADDGDVRRSWALSEVSLSRRKAIGVPKLDAATEAMIAAVKETWPEWEREQPLLVLAGDVEAAEGSVQDDSGASHPVVYGSRSTGLLIL